MENIKYEVDKKKNSECRYYKYGYCKFSNKCKFLHTSHSSQVIHPPAENLKDKKIIQIEKNIPVVENRKESINIDSNNHISSLDHQSEAEIAKLKGNKSYLEGDYNKAFEMYSLAIIYSTEALATFYSNRSNTSIQMKEYNKALSDAEKCIELRPNWTRGYYRKATCLMHLGDTDSAQKYFKKSFESATTDKERDEIKKFINEAGFSMDSQNPEKEKPAPKKGDKGRKLIEFLSKFSEETSEQDSDSNNQMDSYIDDQLDFLISQYIKPHEEDAFKTLSQYHGLDSGELPKEKALEWIKFGLTYGAGESTDLLQALKDYVSITEGSELKGKLEEIFEMCGLN